MTEEFNFLVSDALDELERLSYYRQVLEMAQEQLRQEDKALKRVELLLNLYLPALDCHVDNLRANLRRIQRAVENDAG